MEKPAAPESLGHCPKCGSGEMSKIQYERVNIYNPKKNGHEAHERLVYSCARCAYYTSIFCCDHKKALQTFTSVES